MSYKEDERQRLIQVRDSIFRDAGGARFFGEEREFVLQEATLNLWEGIREDALDYFTRNDISWWMGGESNEPSGHLLSSQIACLNHLFFLRKRGDVATKVLQNIIEDIEVAIVVDDGLVEFEVIGKENYLGERSHTRGANSTSIDAVMVGKRTNATKVLVMIEWKYTESYGPDDKYIPARAMIYDPLIEDPRSPFDVEGSSSLYYDPFDQLMRQSLLGWQMIEHNEYDCRDFLHLHVIPDENQKLRMSVTSPALEGSTMSEAWKGILKEPAKYQTISPEDLLAPIKNSPDTEAYESYMNARYWGSADDGAA